MILSYWWAGAGRNTTNGGPPRWTNNYSFWLGLSPNPTITIHHPLVVWRKNPWAINHSVSSNRQKHSQNWKTNKTEKGKNKPLFYWPKYPPVWPQIANRCPMLGAYSKAEGVSVISYLYWDPQIFLFPVITIEKPHKYQNLTETTSPKLQNLLSLRLCEIFDQRKKKKNDQEVLRRWKLEMRESPIQDLLSSCFLFSLLLFDSCSVWLPRKLSYDSKGSWRFIFMFS